MTPSKQTNVRRLAVVLTGCLAVTVLAGQEDRPADELESDEQWLADLLWGDALQEEDLFGEENLLAPEEADASLKALMEELRSPVFEIGLEAGLGWKENALLSEDGSVDSLFQELVLDGFWHRPSVQDGWEWMAMLFGEYRRFDDVPDLDAEYLALARLIASRKVNMDTKVDLFVGGLLSRQAFDVSLVDFETEAQTVSYWEPEIGVAASKALSPTLGRVRGELGFSRSSFDESEEDYDTSSVAIGWEGKPGEGHVLDVELESYRERYLEKRVLGGDGPLDEPLLRVNGWRSSVEWKWNASQSWFEGSRLRFVWAAEDDPLGDAYRKDRWQLKETLAFARGHWSGQVSLGYGEVDYPGRPLPNLPLTRSDSSLVAKARVVRAWGESLRAFVEYEWTDKDSNQAGYSYESAFVWIGLATSKMYRP